MFNISSLLGQSQRPQFPPPPPPEQGTHSSQGHRPPPGQGPQEMNGNCPPPPPPNQANQLQQLLSQFSSQGYMGQSSSLLQNFLNF